MSSIRLPYYTLSADAYKGFMSVKNALEKSTLGIPLIELRYMRISQINGCPYCLNMHAKSLRSHNETNERIDALPGWRVSKLYSEKERAALNWTELVTNISITDANDESFTQLKEHFTDSEIVDLTMAISLMNAFN
jgi:AhpD family alkylhydroperoxidase